MDRIARELLVVAREIMSADVVDLKSLIKKYGEDAVIDSMSMIDLKDLFKGSGSLFRNWKKIETDFMRGTEEYLEGLNEYPGDKDYALEKAWDSDSNADRASEMRREFIEENLKRLKLSKKVMKELTDELE